MERVYAELFNYRISIAELNTLLTIANALNAHIIFKDKNGNFKLFIIHVNKYYELVFDDENRYIILKQIDECPVVNSVKEHDEFDHYEANSKLIYAISILNHIRKYYLEHVKTCSMDKTLELISYVRRFVFDKHIEEYTMNPVQILPEIYLRYKAKLNSIAIESDY